MPHSAPPDATTYDAPLVVRLLDGFRLDVGPREVVLPVHAQRVLAFLALARPVGAPQRRTTLAERLWCEGSHERAQASLRTALWRIRKADDRLVSADRDRVHLGVDVVVDVERSLGQAERLLSGDGDLAPDDAVTVGLAADLLPGWEEDWLTIERERIHLVRIHALVAMSQRLCKLGQYMAAIEAAYTAISAEPLHESAHAALVDIHLARGDVVQACKQLDHYSRLLWDEMGLRPSCALVARLPALRP